MVVTGMCLVACGLWLVLRLVHISPLTHILAPPPNSNPVPKIALKGPLNKMVVVEDDEGFEKAVADAGDKPIVIDCMASWCKKCAGVFPTVSELSGKHTDAVFLKVGNYPVLCTCLLTSLTSHLSPHTA